jgi:hypothetical protein
VEIPLQAARPSILFLVHSVLNPIGAALIPSVGVVLAERSAHVRLALTVVVEVPDESEAIYG